jgi:hypothetical protein
MERRTVKGHQLESAWTDANWPFTAEQDLAGFLHLAREFFESKQTNPLPNLAAVYRKKVEELESLLDDAEHRDEAMELIRTLIEKIVLTPKEEGDLDALLHGGLARILALCA